ncbi:MAG: 4-hydroxy-3-methylbut-2-enyl diphosphate reductase [Candidatus Omnitrophica bacterium]|nr:4-hydroxy-3-methylbut-2-enyl diphosphate reductase [Candidatus Omnitrophota bacterium]
MNPNVNPELQNPKIIRTSFGLKDEIKPQLEQSYHSPLIDEIKANHFALQKGRLTFRLAQEFGFCYGVDRAIDYAYQTRAKFPDRRIFLTNEIIHNPRVNSKLKEMGMQFLPSDDSGHAMIQDIRKEDVVIIPAFGTPLKELGQLEAKGCILVDTTCGSVMSVWKRVDSYGRDGFTSVIHGKYDHEETLATSSRATRYPDGKFIVVRDKEQAGKVCQYIEGGGKREEFIQEFSKAVSPEFDPDRDLRKIGCANQTTMLSSESLEIANMLQRSMIKRYGEEVTCQNFRHFDTICSATQERQDAVLKLVQEGVDLMVVVGGYNSSNTGHLVEMSLAYCPAFHVKDATCILSREVIQHKKVFSAEIIDTAKWLPEGPIKIGVTAGASTPNRVIEEVIERIIVIA